MEALASESRCDLTVLARSELGSSSIDLVPLRLDAGPVGGRLVQVEEAKVVVDLDVVGLEDGDLLPGRLGAGEVVEVEVDGAAGEEALDVLGIDRQELVEPGGGGLELRRRRRTRRPGPGASAASFGSAWNFAIRSATLAWSTAGAPLVAAATWLAAGAPLDGAGFTIALAPRATAAMAMTAAPPSTIRFQILGPAGAVRGGHRLRRPWGRGAALAASRPASCRRARSGSPSRRGPRGPRLGSPSRSSSIRVRRQPPPRRPPRWPPRRGPEEPEVSPAPPGTTGRTRRAPEGRALESSRVGQGDVRRIERRDLGTSPATDLRGRTGEVVAHRLVELVDVLG